MDLSEAYSKFKKQIFGFDSSYLNNLRENLIQNFELNPVKLKNNESIKHYDKNILKNFEYKFNKINSYNPVINSDIKSVNSIYNNTNLVLEKIKKYENAFHDDYFVNLNTIFQNAGNIFKINSDSKKKIFISNKIDDNQTIFAKNFFDVKENNNTIIVEEFDNHIKSNMNIVNYFEINDNSKTLHLVIQKNKEAANLQFTNFINCHENSQYKQIIFNSSDSSIRNHSYANLKGINSKAYLYGIFFGSSDQLIDNKTVVSHYEPNCNSEQKYKGILTDNAKANYLSKTYVDKKAQKTEAYQLSKGILLSENSHFHSKPELKIYADDVKCSHGSTIGPFDDKILFYIRSRGISQKEGVSMLINSFFSDILEKISDDEYLNLVNNSIFQWLTENNS